MKRRQESIFHKPIWIFIFSLLFIVLLWGVNLLLLVDDPNRGIFGDMFGAVNALYGGLALAGIIYTIIIQHREISDARIQAEEQAKNLQIQTFENTYFQMLQLNNQIVNSIQLPGQGEIQGRGCFEEIYETWLYMQFDAQIKKYPDKPELQQVSDAYFQFYKFGQTVIGHYIRHLHNCLKFIKNNDIGNKQLYADLLIAHLSSFELAILFYHCLSDIGKRNFKPLVEEFGLLEDLHRGLLFRPSHMALYSQTAFEDQSDNQNPLHTRYTLEDLED